MCSLIQNIADSMAALGVSKSQSELVEMVKVRKGEGDAKASAKDGSGKPLKTHL